MLNDLKAIFKSSFCINTNNNGYESIINIYNNNNQNDDEDNYILTFDSNVNNNINNITNIINNNLIMIGMFRHAYFKYDYDDENSPHYVYVYKLK